VRPVGRPNDWQHQHAADFSRRRTHAQVPRATTQWASLRHTRDITIGNRRSGAEGIAWARNA
jgi:hypothetical protein